MTDQTSFTLDQTSLEEPKEGRIYIGDRLLNDVPPKDRDIAMVFQSYALYPHMSVYDPEFTPPDITAGRVKAKVDVTELMGNEVFLYLLTDKRSFIARVDPRTRARVGDEIEAVLNMENMYLFDPRTEKAIR